MTYSDPRRPFSAGEYARRYRLVGEMLAAERLDALLIYGSRYGGDHVRWLTGFPPRHDTLLVWPADDAPTLLVQLFNHVPNAQEIAVIEDVRWGGPDSAETAARRLADLSARRVGIVGRLPYRMHATLSGALADASWTDASAGYARLRLVKSDEEIARLRQGAAFTDAALTALVDAIAPGVSEYELAAAIEGAYTGVGGAHGIHFLSSTPMGRPDSYVPRQNPRGRRLASGDVVICELSAGVGGYNGQIHRPIAVDAPPNATYARLYEVAVDAYSAIVATLKPGSTLAAALDAADRIDAAGLTVCDDLLHGYGAGYLAPVARTRQTAHRKQAPESFQFEANMGIVVQPNVVDPATGAGLQVGNLLLITADGAECLHDHPMTFLRKNFS